LFDRVVDRGGGVHTVSRRETSAGDQNHKRRPCGDLFHSRIPAAAPFHHLVRAEKIYGGRHCRRRVSPGKRRNGGREETILSKLRPAGIVGRGSASVRNK